MANNPRVFLDIAVSSIAVGQIVIEHFAYTNPLTVENFRALCTGEKGIGESDIPLHYKGSVEDSIRSIIHGIDPDHVWFGGYMTQGNGFGGEWIYGDEFPDEECMRKHDRIQFLPHTKEAPDYDEEPPHFAFGQVVSGFDVIRLVERMVGNEFVPFFASVNRCLRSDSFPEYVCVDNVASCATEDGGDGDSIGKAKDCI
ncbi:peptidyl-prolyl cis-trans isomerase-like [Brassica napus]|uniref:peptidyl-prolyl cis-trans isomerase-like n=1 Tax=Brassica napus TaxID=3708 RepID=UPI0020784B76|nr:peptidyl-prolyl cis-trans isomerase-like [Brassica napus]